MVKVGLHDLAQSAATDGQIPAWDDASGLWVPVDPPTGGGGGSSDVEYLRTLAPAGHTTIDEFRTTTLPGTQVDNPTGGAGRVSWAVGSDVLEADIIGGDGANELHARMWDISIYGGTVNVGDYFYTYIQLGRVGSWAIGGICLMDGTTYGSNGGVIGMYLNDGSVNTRTYTNYGSQASSATGAAGVLNVQPIYLRLIYAATNSWRCDWSLGGKIWRTSTAVSKTFTPTHVGVFVSSFGTSTRGMALFDTIRRAA